MNFYLIKLCGCLNNIIFAVFHILMTKKFEKIWKYKITKYKKYKLDYPRKGSMIWTQLMSFMVTIIILFTNYIILKLYQL